MEEFIINPDKYKDKYISNLNRCFNGWGGEREYEWAFERKIGKHSSDILLIQNEEDGIIAGSAISYRKISGKNTQEIIEIGIMTGSWTLPAARRKGCFTKMINCSKELCKRNAVPFLTAFVTESNPSSRRLAAEGSFLLNSYHLFSPEEPFDNVDQNDIFEMKDISVDDIYAAKKRTEANLLSFGYSKEEFRSQYLDRIKKTTVLKIKDDFAIIENGNNEMKVLLLTYSSPEIFSVNLKLLTNWCLKNTSKKAFFYTTRKELYSECSKLGFENVPGYFTILRTAEDSINYEEQFSSLNINMGDKM